jgi:hypothetical protein
MPASASAQRSPSVSPMAPPGERTGEHGDGVEQALGGIGAPAQLRRDARLPERDLVHAGDGRRAVAEELLRDEEADPEECGVACQWHEEQRRAEHADAEGDGTRGAEGTPDRSRDERPAEARQAAGREDQPEDTRSQSELAGDEEQEHGREDAEGKGGRRVGQADRAEERIAGDHGDPGDGLVPQPDGLARDDRGLLGCRDPGETGCGQEEGRRIDRDRVRRPEPLHQPATGRECQHLGSGRAGRQACVGGDQRFTCDQRRYVGVLCDGEDRVERARHERHRVQHLEAQPTSRGSHRDQSEHGGTAQICRQQQRAAAHAIQPGCGEDAGGETRDQVRHRQERHVERRRVEHEDRGERQRRARHERAEHRDRVRGPQPSKRREPRASVAQTTS